MTEKLIISGVSNFTGKSSCNDKGHEKFNFE